VALHKNKKIASTASTGAATSSTRLGHLLPGPTAIIDLDLPDHISFLDTFLFEDDFSD